MTTSARFRNLKSRPLLCRLGQVSRILAAPALPAPDAQSQSTASGTVSTHDVCLTDTSNIMDHDMLRLPGVTNWSNYCISHLT